MAKDHKITEWKRLVNALAKALWNMRRNRMQY